MYEAIENNPLEGEKLVLRDTREKTGQTGSPREEWDSNQRRCEPLRGAQTGFHLCYGSGAVMDERDAGVWLHLGVCGALFP